MADNKIALDLTINGDGAVQTLGELENALKDTNTEFKKAEKSTDSLEDQFNALDKSIKEAPVSIRAMNKQIQEYQAFALKAGRETPIGKKALQEAANLRDRYVDIQNEVKRLSNDGIKMQAALDFGTTLVGGFSAFQGAMAMTGLQSEDLQKTLVKLQAAQSVLVGIETIRKNLEKESTLVLVAKTAAEKAHAIALGITTKATKGFTNALLATGLGAIVVGIGLLIAKWDDLTEAIGINTKEQQLNSEVTDKALEKVAEELSAADKLKKTLDDENVSREDKNQAIKDLQAEYPNLLSNIDAESASLEDVNKALELNTKLLVLRAKQEAIASLRAEEFKEQLKAEADAQTGANVGWYESALALTGYADAQSIANAGTKEAIAESNKQITAYDDLDKSIQNEIDSLLELGAVGEKEIETEKKRTEELKKQNKELTEKEKWERNIREMMANNHEIEKVERIEKKDLVNKEIEGQLQLRDSYVLTEEEKIKATNRFTEEYLSNLEERNAANQANIDKAQAGLDVLNAASDLFIKDEKKREKVKKKLAAAQLAIDTARAISSGIASASAVPFPGNIAAILSIVATVLANVAQAKNLLSSAGANVGDLGSAASAASSGGAGGGVPINPVSNTSTMLGDQKVYVTEADISKTQKKVKTIESWATH